MKIGIDIGALCGKRFGNNIFTINLIKELAKSDKKNLYFLYAFCNKPNSLKLSKNFSYKKLLPKQLWIKGTVWFEELKNKKDVFLGLNQAFPKSSSKKIIFSHGLSFLKYKSLYPDSYNKMFKQVKNMVKSADHVIVSSIKVQSEFKKLFNTDSKVKVLNFGIPFDFLRPSNSKKRKYFLNVGINHPIKNINFLIDCFTKFNLNQKDQYKLYLVLDRKYTNIKDRNIIQITNISRKRLKTLYSKSCAYLSISFYESFNFPVLEALSQNTPVIGLKDSIIPELRGYVRVVNNESEFINAMNTKNFKSRKINLKKLKKDFSWKKYVDELLKMY